jgi:hypothetical protein
MPVYNSYSKALCLFYILIHTRGLNSSVFCYDFIAKEWILDMRVDLWKYETQISWKLGLIKAGCENVWEIDEKMFLCGN